jgi:molecular chaperone GrpE
MNDDKEKRTPGGPRAAAAQAGTGPAADIEALGRALEDTRAEAESYKDLYLRVRADLDNQQKRVAHEIETRTGFAKDALIRALLPVKDGLEAGLAGTATVADPAVAPFREGVEVALRGWDAAFAAAGVEEIRPLGLPFDPERHEALSVRPAVAPELPNTVVEVSQKGYTLDGRLIRPALVVVGQ